MDTVEAERVMPEAVALLRILESSYKEIIAPSRYNFSPNFKGHENPYTHLDIETQKHIQKLLDPKTPVFGEENFQMDDLKGVGSFFITDPIDGTTNFIRHSKFWGQIACKVYNNSPLYATIYLPELGDYAVCHKGKGGYLNGKKISTPTADPNLTPLLYSEGPSIKGIKSRRLGSHAVSTIELIKCGGVFKNPVKIWEYYAMILFIKELGGKVCNFKGEDHELGEESIDLCGGFSDKYIVDVLNEAQPKQPGLNL